MSPVLDATDFSAGIYKALKGQRAPKNSVRDLVNGIVLADGSIVKRGGMSQRYDHSGQGGGGMTFIRGGFRMALEGQSAELVSLGDASNGRIVERIGAATVWGPYSGLTRTPIRQIVREHDRVGIATGIRGAAYSTNDATHGFLALPPAPGSADASAGGTISTTLGSPIVTGVGTTFTSAHVGKFVRPTGQGDALLVIRRVINATSLELTRPVTSANVLTAATYSIAGTLLMTPFGIPTETTNALFTIALAGNRVCGVKQGIPARMSFTLPNRWQTLDNFHDFPFTITAIHGIGDSLLVFGGTEMWRVDGLALGIVDAAGNPQHAVQKVFDDVGCLAPECLAVWRGLLLWADARGVYLWDFVGRPRNLLAGGGEGLVADWQTFCATWTVDDYLFGAVVRNHYVIGRAKFSTSTNADNDVWAVNLETGTWAKWDVANAQGFDQGYADQEPLLLTALSNTPRSLTAADSFQPSSATKTEGDGTTPTLTVETRDADAGPYTVAWRKVEVHGEMTDASADNPVLDVDYALDESATFVDLGTDLAETVAGEGRIGVYRFGKKSRSIRFRLTTANASALTRITRLLVTYRPGRQR